MTLTEQAISTIIRAGREALLGDHERLCEGRNYSCSCGYDTAKDKALSDALEALCALAQEALQSRREGQQMREEHEILANNVIALGGYLINAKIDLETGAKKTTAIATIEGGLRIVDAAKAGLTRIRALSHPKPESVKSSARSNPPTRR